MSRWIAEFDLENGDTMPEHMDLEYMGAKLDFHCRPMWIPVTERLPEENQRVLVTICTKQKSLRVRSGTYYKRIFMNDNGDCWGCIDKGVKAWAPLPEPYKEEKK